MVTLLELLLDFDELETTLDFELLTEDGTLELDELETELDLDELAMLATEELLVPWQPAPLPQSQTMSSIAISKVDCGN